MENTVELTDVEMVAVADTLKKMADVKKNLPAGKYSVNCLVRVQADITKSEAIEKKVPASLKKEDMLMYLLSKMNRNTRQATLKTFAGGEYEIPAELNDELKEDWNALSLTTTRLTGGRTTVKGTVRKVEEVDHDTGK